MPQHKAKYLESLDTHVEVELSIPLHDFIRTIAEHNKQSMSDVCFEMLNLAQLDRRWVEEYKKGRPYDSRYASRRKKQVIEELDLTPKQTEDFEKLLMIAKLIGIDTLGIAKSLS